MEYEYKVIDVADGGVSTVLVGDGRIETAVLQAYLNAMAADGWRMVFMEEVLQRYMLTSDRETLMVTFERRVPEGQRQDCAARYDQAGRQKAVKLAAFGDASFAQIKRKAEKLRSEVVMGGDPAAAKADAKAVPLYAELAAMHMADAELHQRSYSTTEAYMRVHVVPRWGRVRLTDIDSRSVARWLASKRDEGLAPATVVKIRAIFSRSFELGARWGVAGCERNPVRAVESKPVNNARERYVTAEEAAPLIEAARASRNPRLAEVVQLLLLTGMRVSELLSARWGDCQDFRVWAGIMGTRSSPYVRAQRTDDTERAARPVAGRRGGQRCL